MTDRTIWPWNAAPEDCDDYDAAVWHAAKPPQTLEEWVQGQRASRALDRTLPKAKAAPAALHLVSLDAFDVRAVDWVDKPFLQRAAFHLLAGRKGTCKGTYLAGLCARMTIGTMGGPKRVLVVTSEDSVELDFLPRFLAAQGVPGLCSIVKGDFRLPRDIAWIKQTARELGDVGLIVIDPIGNHLSNTDTDGEGAVRNAIGPLNELADELDAMVFGVRHLSKSSANGALASVLGSTAWVDVPRCVILMAADDEDPMVFHYQVVAGNRGPRGAGRLISLAIVDVPPAIDVTLAVDAGESDKDVEALLMAKATKDERAKSVQARELMLSILECDGEQESDTLTARIALETGLTAKTIRNVKADLSNAGLLVNFPLKDEMGSVSQWFVKRTHAPLPAPVPTLNKPDPESEDFGF
jgi:hypothetical protein